ncbi:MAG: hypothetical protein II663_06920, partial [Bacteroidales bacterium]|nr:hypothetical protein [Bacteroidales bacterium]
MFCKRIIIMVLFALMAYGSMGQNNNIFVRKEDNPELKVTVTGYFGISLMTSYTGFIRYGYTIFVRTT